jgi:hypothetical protein
MSVAIQTVGESGIEVNVVDKLTVQDYQRFRELADQMIERRGEINLLVVLKYFTGWTPAALWADLKFDVTHYNDVARLAVVGKDPSQHWMATVSRPFTAAQVKYYSFDDIDMAREWVAERSAKLSAAGFK